MGRGMGASCCRLSAICFGASRPGTRPGTPVSTRLPESYVYQPGESLRTGTWAEEREGMTTSGMTAAEPRGERLEPIRRLNRSAPADVRAIPPEAHLVFLSAVGGWADGVITELVAGGPSWSRVLAFARSERAVPALLRRLEALGVADELPSNVLAPLRQMANVEEFGMVVLEDRLRLLLARLGTHGLDVVLLKGAAVALHHLGGLEKRPMGDVDLLARPGEAERIQAVALDLGWTPVGRGLEEWMYVDMHHLKPLEAPDGLGFGLEVHTDLFPAWGPFGFSAPDIWRDAVQSGAWRGGVPIRVPSVQHQVLHTCLHFAWSHCFARGSWRMVRDLDVLLEDPGFDAPALTQLAREAGGASCVWWTLTLMQVLTGRPIPDGLLQELESSVPRTGRGIVLGHLVRESLRLPAPPGTLRLRKVLWTRAVAPRRNGHGAGRPWASGGRWPDPEDPFGTAGPRLDPWHVRAGGMLRYLSRIAAGG